MTAPTRTQRGADDPARGAVEPSDIDPRWARRTLAAILAMLAVVAAGVAALFWALGSLRQPPAKPPRIAAPAPALQPEEAADRPALDARAARTLARGQPIRAAMRATAAAGWDAPR